MFRFRYNSIIAVVNSIVFASSRRRRVYFMGGYRAAVTAEEQHRATDIRLVRGVVGGNGCGGFLLVVAGSTGRRCVSILGGNCTIFLCVYNIILYYIMSGAHVPPAAASIGLPQFPTLPECARASAPAYPTLFTTTHLATSRLFRLQRAARFHSSPQHRSAPSQWCRSSPEYNISTRSPTIRRFQNNISQSPVPCSVSPLPTRVFVVPEQTRFLPPPSLHSRPGKIITVITFLKLVDNNVSV